MHAETALLALYAIRLDSYSPSTRVTLATTALLVRHTPASSRALPVDSRTKHTLKPRQTAASVQRDSHAGMV